MKKIKKLMTVIAATLSLLVSGAGLNAQCCTDWDGCAYEDCQTAPCISPYAALGSVALIAVVAILLHNEHGHHSHNHSH